MSADGARLRLWGSKLATLRTVNWDRTLEWEWRLQRDGRCWYRQLSKDGRHLDPSWDYGGKVDKQERHSARSNKQYAHDLLRGIAEHTTGHYIPEDSEPERPGGGALRRGRPR